jgi:hypothetical protein
MSKTVIDAPAPAKGKHYNNKEKQGNCPTLQGHCFQAPPLQSNSKAPPKATDDSSSPVTFSMDCEDTTKKASKLTSKSSKKDKMAMAKELLAAIAGDDDLKNMFKQALQPSASPDLGVGANG